MCLFVSSCFFVLFFHVFQPVRRRRRNCLSLFDESAVAADAHSGDDDDGNDSSISGSFIDNRSVSDLIVYSYQVKIIFLLPFTSAPACVFVSLRAYEAWVLVTYSFSLVLM